MLCAPLLQACAPASALTTIRVTEDIVLANPTRLGVNIGPSYYGGDQQHVVNPFIHGGFHQGRQALLVPVRDASGNAFTDAYHERSDADRHYVESFEGGTYCIATGSRAGETGAIAAHDIETGRYTLEHSGAPLANEDLVWLRGPWVRRVQPDAEDESLEPTIGIGDFRPIVEDGVSLEFIDTDTEARDQALRIAFAPGEGRKQGGVKHYIRGTTDNTYTVVVRARCDQPGAQLGVLLRNHGIAEDEPGGEIRLRAPEAVVLTPEFQEYRFTGQTYPDKRIYDENSVFLIAVTADSLADTPIHADIDSIRLEDASMDSPSGFNKQMVEAIKEAACGSLRFYGVASLASPVEDFTARDTTDAAWTYASLQSMGRFSGTDAVIDQWLALSEEASAEPWLTIGGANTPDEWHDLISYLCAPQEFDAYSRRRADNGNAPPWTERFGRIRLEIGNEWWNPVFRPYYAMPPEKYGELCNTIIKRVQAHPHFDAKKIEIVAGGWAVNGHHWNGVVDRVAEGHDTISIAPYLLHKLDKFGEEERFAALFADVEAYAGNGGASTLADLADNGKGTRRAVYELNTHTDGGGAPASIASTLTSSAAAGVAVLDQAMALMSRMQANPINYFTVLQRSYNNRLGLWGTLIREPSGAMRPRPVWHGLRLANQYLIAGNMVSAVAEGGPTWDQPENGSVPRTDDIPYIASYAFLDAEASPRALNVLVVNRHLKEALDISFALPFAVESEARRIALAPETLDANNEDSETVRLTESTLGGIQVGAVTSVPPFSATVFRFVEAL